jgi:hypothetical protein
LRLLYFTKKTAHQATLNEGTARTFTPFDRFAQLRDSQGKSFQELPDAFALERRLFYINNCCIGLYKKFTVPKIEYDINFGDRVKPSYHHNIQIISYLG